MAEERSALDQKAAEAAAKVKAAETALTLTLALALTLTLPLTYCKARGSVPRVPAWLFWMHSRNSSRRSGWMHSLTYM